MTSIVSVADIDLTLAVSLVAALGLPFVGAMILVGVGKHLKHSTFPGRLATVLAGTATLSLLGLLSYQNYDIPLFVWLPPAGPVGLHLGGLGGQVATATAAVLVLGMLVSPPDNRTSWAALLAALSAANVSFLAGDFLTRYGALEILGLVIALTPLAERLQGGIRKAKEVYVFLRIGDVGLLIAILVLLDAGGTLAIAEALDAGTRLTGTPLGWVAGGMLTAVWVKTGAWPFHRWGAAADDLSPLVAAWLYGLVMPNLGLYLLYRVTPLLALDPLTGPLTLGLAIIGILAVTGQLLIRGFRALTPAQFNAVLGCAALGLAATGRQDVLTGLLLVGTPLRFAAWLALRRQLHSQGARTGIVERATLEDQLLKSSQAVSRIVEERLLQQAVAGVWRMIVGTAHFWYRTSELDAAGFVVRASTQSALSFSHWLQHNHTGRLRSNLQWVTLGLIVIVAFVMATGW